MEIQRSSHKNFIARYSICLLLISGAGIVGFFVGKSSIVFPVAQQRPAIEAVVTKGEAPVRTPTEKAETGELKFLYGQIIERKENKLLVQQLLLTGEYGATIYLIQADDRTNVEYVPSKTLKGEPGALDGIKKGMYVFIATRSQLVASPAIYAESVTYSEVSPIRGQSLIEE